MPNIPGAADIQYQKLKFDLLRGPNAPKTDLWLVIQERSMNGRFYQPIFEHIQRFSIPCLTLLFETPNWPASELPAFPHGTQDSLLEELKNLGSQFICSSDLGAQWAKSYWPEACPTRFHVCNPPTLAAFFDAPQDRMNNLLVCICRRITPHKGISNLASLAKSEFKGYHVEILDSSPSDPSSTEYLRALNEANGARFRIHRNVSELEKFLLLKRARCLLFPSLFEGFGLPPAEAGYWGTPTVAIDLPVLREIYGDDIRYAPKGEFGETVLQELESEPNYQPRSSARRIGDYNRWAEELETIANLVKRSKRAAPEGVYSRNDWSVLVIDQLGDWNCNDALAALGQPLSPRLGFNRDWLNRWHANLLASGSGANALPILVADPHDKLREQLINALERIDTAYVILTEDLLVLTKEHAQSAIDLLQGKPLATGAAIPVRYHYQKSGPQHYLTESGELLAMCGAFHRERLLKTLRATRHSGCSLQPIIDFSYAIISQGQHLVPANGWAERLPPRHMGFEWDVLPAEGDSWHREYKGDPIGPVPCSNPADHQELAAKASIRRKGLMLYAQADQGFIQQELLEEILSGLSSLSGLWQNFASIHDTPMRTLQIENNYPSLSPYFFSRSVLNLVARSWEASQHGQAIRFKQTLVHLRKGSKI